MGTRSIERAIQLILKRTAEQCCSKMDQSRAVSGQADMPGKICAWLSVRQGYMSWVYGLDSS